MWAARCFGVNATGNWNAGHGHFDAVLHRLDSIDGTAPSVLENRLLIWDMLQPFRSIVGQGLDAEHLFKVHRATFVRLP